MKRFELLNKDIVVLRFRYDEELHRIDSLISIENAAYASPALIDTDGSISLRNLIRWWTHRSIPASRAQLDRLKVTLSIDSTLELLEKNFALSLSDRYWVREQGQELSWSDVNFFDNSFSDDLGVITLDPSSSGTHAQLDPSDLMNPNSSVGGNLPKKWIIEQGTRYLVKRGIQHFEQDAYNEVVATSLCQRILEPDDYVPYTLVRTADGVFCRCPEFLAEDEELVTVDDLLRRHANDRNYGTYLSILGALEETGIPSGQLQTGLTKLFTVDFLMANSDRHTNNFGVIRDVTTLEYKRLAPVFDTGFSLWCDKRSLTRASDYDYRPRPFTNTEESPLRQLRLFDSYEWFDGANLEGWADEACEILDGNELMPAGRIDAIHQGIEQNVRNCQTHVEKMRAWKATSARRSR